MPHPHHHALDPRTLAAAPELATLAVLDALLFTVTRVLVAEHPTLVDDNHASARRLEPPTLWHARRVLRRIRPLQGVLAEYRGAVFDALSPGPSSREDESLF